MHMKIAAFEVSDRDAAALREMLPGHEIIPVEETLTEATASKAAGCDAVSVFIYSTVNQAVIDAIPGLTLIATRSTGFDHVDVAHAKAKGITVCTVPAYGSHTVAEFTFALLLSLSRKIFQARLQLLEGGPFSYQGLDGFDLYGKTLGVIGTGKIGKNVILIGKAFNMKIVASDPYPDNAFAQAQGYPYLSIDEVLAQSDVVTLHVPASKDTRYLIGSHNIDTMKQGAVLINTARGDLVETAAVVRALESGRLAGFGVDALENERGLRDEAELLARSEGLSDYKVPFDNHVLLQHPRVIVTPHIGFCSREAIQDILQTTAKNIDGFAKGASQNVVPA